MSLASKKQSVRASRLASRASRFAYLIAFMFLTITLASTYSVLIKDKSNSKPKECCIVLDGKGGVGGNAEGNDSALEVITNFIGGVGDFYYLGFSELYSVYDYYKSSNRDSFSIKKPGNLFVGLIVVLAFAAYVFVYWGNPKGIIRHVYNFLFRYILPSRSFWFRKWLRPAGGRQESVPSEAFRFLLPGQQQVVRKFYDLATELGSHAPGRMVGMTASWGGGKSYVSNYLAQHGFDGLNSQRQGGYQFAVVQISAWSAQTDHDLHLGMVKAILGNEVLFNKCSSQYPTRLLAAPLISGLGLLVPRGIEVALGATKATVGAGSPLPMFWQEEFAYVISKAVENNIRLVVILDEIDRCEPVMAQAAMTMARRALDMPGVLTIVPFVEEKIDYSVFSPVQAILPDLRASIFSVLAEEFTFSPSLYAPYSLFGPAMYPTQGSTGPVSYSTDGTDSDAGGSKHALVSDRRMQIEGRYAQERYLLDEYWKRVVEDGSSSSGRIWKSRVHRKFREKYLAESYEVEGLTAVGLGQFVTECKTNFESDMGHIIDQVSQLLGGETERHAVISMIKGAAYRLVSGGVKIKFDQRGAVPGDELIVVPGGPIRSIRSFQGAFASMISKYCNDIRSNAYDVGLEDDPERRKKVALEIITTVLILASVAMVVDAPHGEYNSYLGDVM